MPRRGIIKLKSRPASRRPASAKSPDLGRPPCRSGQAWSFPGVETLPLRLSDCLFQLTRQGDVVPVFRTRTPRHQSRESRRVQLNRRETSPPD
jgi:hypothetical protein